MAFTGDVFDCTGATVTIDAVELGLGGTTSVKCKKLYAAKEIRNFGNFPEPAEEALKDWVEGSIEFQLSKAQDLPAVGVTPVDLVITAEGFKFDGEARLSDLEISLGSGDEDLCTGTVNFKSRPNYGATTNYTLNNNPAA